MARVHDVLRRGFKSAFSEVPAQFTNNCSNLTTSTCWLYVILLTYTNNDTGVAFPGYETLNKRTHMKYNTISKGIKQLEAFGWMSREKRFGGSTIYTLLIPDKYLTVEDLTPASPTQKDRTVPTQKDRANPTQKGRVSPTQKDRLTRSILTKSISEEEREGEQTAVAALAPFQESESIIKSWCLKEPVEKVCVWFSNFSGVAVTQHDRARWVKGAITIASQQPTERDIYKAVELAREKKYHYTQPGGIYEFLKEVMVKPKVITAIPTYEIITEEELIRRGLA